jgi:hypothetical protein
MGYLPKTWMRWGLYSETEKRVEHPRRLPVMNMETPTKKPRKNLGAEKLDWNENDKQRFLGHIGEKTSSGCTIWRGPVNKGYGRIRVRGRGITAHRAAYIMFIGPIATEMVVDHLCRNQLCVNPGHLEATTNGENVLRGFSNSAVNARKTHCNRGHPFDAENTQVSTAGKRKCRTCAREHWNKSKNRKRAALSTKPQDQ